MDLRPITLRRFIAADNPKAPEIGHNDVRPPASCSPPEDLVRTGVHCKTSRVFLIEDDPLFRNALVCLLGSIGQAVDAFDNISEFLAHVRKDEPNCLVLDIRLPGGSGLELQSTLHRAADFIPIIFVTGYGDVATAVSAMKAGAADFFSKPVREQDLLDAISAALARDTGMRAERAALVALRKRYDTLTPREREVMILVTNGDSNRTIAAELGITEVTVKIHRRRAFRKMDAPSLAALVRMVDQLHLC